MKNKIEFYRIIILLFVIYAFMQFLITLLSIGIVNFKLNIYYLLILKILSYIGIIYLLFFYIKSTPHIKPWVFILSLVVYLFPKNLLYTFSIEELRYLSEIMFYEKSSEVIFKLTFGLLAFFSLYMQTNKVDKRELRE